MDKNIKENNKKNGIYIRGDVISNSAKIVKMKDRIALLVRSSKSPSMPKREMGQFTARRYVCTYLRRRLVRSYVQTRPTGCQNILVD